MFNYVGKYFWALGTVLCSAERQVLFPEVSFIVLLFGISFFMHLDSLFHLYFLSMALFMEELSLQANHYFLPLLNVRESIDFPSFSFSLVILMVFTAFMV